MDFPNLQEDLALVIIFDYLTYLFISVKAVLLDKIQYVLKCIYIILIKYTDVIL